MGWLGWTEQETLDTDIGSIEIAYKARVEMLNLVIRAVVGQAAEPDTAAAVKPKAGLKPTPANWAHVFGVLSGGKLKQ